MRKIVASRRGAHEDWVSWIRRATAAAVNWREKVGVRKWCEAHAKAKWEWAGHVMRRGGLTWVDKTTRWRDSEWGAAQPKGGNAYGRSGMRTFVRPKCRRWLRWEDSLRKFAKEKRLGTWQELTADSEEGRARWKGLKENYVCWYTGKS